LAEGRTQDSLARYRARRDFTRTAEPPGGAVAPGTSVFVVQKHAARRLHYDLRLQFGDTLKSWAVPQGPSLDPAVRRLAVHTEDHPLQYADFEAQIPKGQYGAGAMIVWDRGIWVPMGDPEADYRKGTLKFRLLGEKLGGGWTLVRLKPKEGERAESWLLIKERDPYARPGSDAAILEERPDSVLSGRRIEDLAAPEAPGGPARKARPEPVAAAALEGARPASLPASFRPQLATPAARPPEGEEWLHEIKFDGYRTIARLDRGAVRLWTRTGLDWTDRYGVLVECFRGLPCQEALIDGEIVVQDEQGIASFAALQDALAEGRTQELIFFAFKIKCRQSGAFKIVGFSASEAAGGIGALLLAEEDEGGLRYVGRVGTGFSMAQMSSLLARLQELRVKKPALTLPPEERRRKDLVWVRPMLVAEVEYGNRTADGILRHAVYKRLRLDAVEDESGAPAPQRQARPERKRYVTEADLAQVMVTNPDRVMFGAGGPTKLELVLYYARVGDWMLPELVNRPVSLVRCPSGKSADCFFQRHAMTGMPEMIRTIPLREEGSKKRADYLYIEDARGLLALAQFGAVEFHSWGCRVDQPERPDRIVFDLDPDEGLPWREVVSAARHVADLLRGLGLVPFLKTTGGKGLHVVVPIARRQGWPEVRRFCEAFARQQAEQAPKRFTANMAKRERRGRIYLDYLRNARSATAVAAYSLRARQGLPASVPLAWDELGAIDDPADLNYATVPQRLEAAVADPWAGIDQAARALTKDMERALQTRA
jgi:bifunctional non-homologous end joining protein LigD